MKRRNSILISSNISKSRKRKDNLLALIGNNIKATNQKLNDPEHKKLSKREEKMKENWRIYRKGAGVIWQDESLNEKEKELIGSTPAPTPSGTTTDKSQTEKETPKGDDKVKEEEVKELKRRIEFLEVRKDKISRRMIPGIDYNYDYSECDNKIKQYEKVIKRIDSRNELNSHDKKEIEEANRLHSLLLQEYGINEKGFKHEETEYIFGSSHKYMKKVKSKTKGNIRIVKNDYYL